MRVAESEESAAQETDYGYALVEPIQEKLIDWHVNTPAFNSSFQSSGSSSPSLRRSKSDGSDAGASPMGRGRADAPSASPTKGTTDRRLAALKGESPTKDSARRGSQSPVRRRVGSVR